MADKPKPKVPENASQNIMVQQPSGAAEHAELLTADPMTAAMQIAEDKAEAHSEAKPEKLTKDEKDFVAAQREIGVPSTMNARSIPGVHRDHLPTDMSRPIGIDAVPHGPKSLAVIPNKFKDHEVFGVPETQEGSAPENPPLSTGDPNGEAQRARVEARNERIASIREDEAKSAKEAKKASKDS